MFNPGKSFGKVNIFLKVTGQRGEYHEFLSRFMRLETIYDDVQFIPSSQSKFVLDGNFSCSLENNTIYRAYLGLLNHNVNSGKIREFFCRHRVSVVKRIPEGSGFGGGSSNAAMFLQMANDCCRLGLSTDELCQIGQAVGADVPFFLYNTDSANVMGVGEKVEPIFESALDIKIFTPKIKCCTGDVYRNFRKNYYKELSAKQFEEFKMASSRQILETLDARSANDLCDSALELYPDLRNFIKDGWFLTGSGSTMFSLK